MAKCSDCNTIFDGEYCPQCGKRVHKEQNCPKCGTICNADAKFCTKCGCALQENVKQGEKKDDGLFVMTVTRILPAVFMLLFSGLLFLLYSTPVIKDELLFGAINLRENIYGLMKTEKYGAVAVFVYYAVFLAVFSTVYFVFACLPSRWQKIGEKLYLLDLISYMGAAFYVIALIMGCVLFAKIGSQRVVGEASCQVLLLIFTLVFMVTHVAYILSWGIISRKYAPLQLPANSWYVRKNKGCVAILSVALALTIAGLTIWEFLPKIRYELGMDSTECGTYYLLKDGEIQEDTYIVLELENHWRNSKNFSGTYTLAEDGAIELKVISYNDNPIGYIGTLDGDKLVVKCTAFGFLFSFLEGTYVKGEDLEEDSSAQEPVPETWTAVGTYYLMEDGVANGKKYIILKEGNTWEDSGLLSGTYTLDENGNIEMTALSVEGVSAGYRGTLIGDTLKIKYMAAFVTVGDTREYQRNVSFEEHSSSNNPNLT